MRYALGTLVAAFGLLGFAAGQSLPELENGFRQPPDSAKPHVWWHWMNGNVTKEGITADLEAMKEAGIGGAQIFDAHCGIPEGDIAYNSPAWFDMVKWAAQEARRLGIEICLANCAGWSSSGGPWNTPEFGMKFVEQTETRVRGPARFSGVLPQPPNPHGFYGDIAVLAFPTPDAEKVTMDEAGVRITTTLVSDEKKLSAINRSSGGMPFSFGRQAKEEPFVLLSFPQPYAASRLLICLTGAGEGSAPCKIRMEASDDGQSFRKIQSATVNTHFGHWQEVPDRQQVDFPETRAKFFRVVFESPASSSTPYILRELRIDRRVELTRLQQKIFRTRGDVRREAIATRPDQVLPKGSVVNLTAKMAKDGKLEWEVPAGDWTILRIGYACNGRNNHPASKAGTGLECDKLSKAAMQHHFAGYLEKMVRHLGAFAGNASSGLNNTLVDSYEVGSQNWTQGFEKEFQARCGYDITPFLPVFAGHIVENADVTERFLWDFRRTVADLFAENYAGELARLAHQHGLLFSCEPYGNSPSDDLQYGQDVDIPMGEFWPGEIGNVNSGNARLPATMAHVYGRKYAGAEAFTAAPDSGKWLKDPYAIKAQGDRVYCGGVNRMIYHRYCHQPWTKPTYYPGMTMGQWGTHFERTVTWWNQGKDWLKYQARCQYLLQEGRFIADALFFCGEDAPNGMTGSMPYGYDFDSCATAVLKTLKVKDGILTLPSGMEYRMLVLPNRKTMTYGTLREIGRLVAAGATVVGPMPEAEPGLADYPNGDGRVKALAQEIWAKGVLTCSVPDALKKLDIRPDFACREKDANVSYIHRRYGATDAYFVAQPKITGQTVTCTFRVTGKTPEFWHPETGAIERVPVYREEDGMTTLPIPFDPAGSVFVVFRDGSAPKNHAVDVNVKVEPRHDVSKPVHELKIVKAEYGYFPGQVPPNCVDVTDIVRNAVKKSGSIRVENTTMGGQDPAPLVFKSLLAEYTLNGEKKSAVVEEHGRLSLPQDAVVEKATYGVVDPDFVPPPKQATDLTKRLAELVQDGELRVQGNNALAGLDPAVNIVKETVVTFSYDGNEQTLRFPENAWILLPGAREEAVPPPDCEIRADRDGALTLSCWQPLRAEVTMADGKKVAVASSASATVPVEGAWELAFPPNWGAPERVTLPKLISWTEHADNGVKYFSGTATYTKRIPLTRRLGANQRLVLDLGLVKNFAEVTVNGTAYPVLWKPPFRLDVTEAARRAQGTLELAVKVTNLWPNRLIGDEQLPDDREWNGKELKAIPQWVKEGKKSPTGRYTFTTWHHWTADDEPLPSGILGPVVLRVVEEVTVGR